MASLLSPSQTKTSHTLLQYPRSMSQQQSSLRSSSQTPSRWQATVKCKQIFAHPTERQDRRSYRLQPSAQYLPSIKKNSIAEVANRRLNKGHIKVPSILVCQALLGQEDPQWTLSERDYPLGEVVLGLEIRSHSVKGALVDTGNGEFVRPGVVAKVNEATAENILNAIQKVVIKEEWTGPVGCSVTMAVWRMLGRDHDTVEAKIAGALPQCQGEVAVLIHKHAAAHTLFAFTRWKGEMGRVVTVTMGLGMGVVLYERGEDRGGDYTQLTWTWPSGLWELRSRMGFTGMTPPPPTLPDPGNPSEGDKSTLDSSADKIQQDWDDYIDFAVEYLQNVADKLKPDLIVLFPTGDASEQPAVRGMAELATRVKGVRLELPPSSVLTGAMVKGAAKGALVATLYSLRAEKKLSEALGKRLGGNQYSMPSLPPWKVKKNFEILNVSGSGKLGVADLSAGVKDLGIELRPEEVKGLLKRMKKFSGGSDGAISREIQLDLTDFSNWCKHVYKDAFVQLVLSSVEFKAALDDDRYDRTVVKIGASDCRSCRKFERSFEELAKKFTTIRFVTLSLDQNDSTSRLGGILQIKGTPTFLMYRGRREVHRILGGNVIKLQSALEELEKEVSFEDVDEESNLEAIV